MAHTSNTVNYFALSATLLLLSFNAHSDEVSDRIQA